MPLDFSADDRNVPLETRILREAQNLADEFAGIFNFETIHRYVQESTDSLQNVRIPDYVHLLAGRFARDRLKALARTQGSLKEDSPLDSSPLQSQCRALADGSSVHRPLGAG